jgi:hypothetical protein
MKCMTVATTMPSSIGQVQTCRESWPEAMSEALAAGVGPAKTDRRSGLRDRTSPGVETKVSEFSNLLMARDF